MNTKNINVITKRVINPEDFIGKRFKPSIQTIATFTKLFSSIYSDFANLIEIKSIEWQRTEYNIMVLEKKSGEILHMTLKDNFGNKRCSGVLCTDHICTGVHYEIQNDTLLKFLVHFIIKGKDILFNDLLKILTRDLKAKKEYYQVFWKSERPPFSVIQDWGYPLQKFRFLVQEGVMRNTDQSIRLNLPEASLHHSERECQGISPNNKNTGYHFFNFPAGFYNHNFDKYYFLSDEEKKTYLLGDNNGYGMGISTDLNEEDIVMGKGTDKLSRAIDYVIENADKNNIKVVSFNCCCVPRIVGDDIYSVLKKAKENMNIPFVFQGQLEKTPYEQKTLLLESYIDKIDINNIEKLKNSVSLFGYHENEYQKKLGDILLKNGVKINTSFIPSIDVRLLPLMYKSDLFIFSPNNFQKEVFEYPFQSISTKFINPKYPYSIKYSDEWINKIFSEFNIIFEEENNIKEYKNTYYGLVEYVKERKYSIGIILIGKKELERFLNPDYVNNIDILYFLEEMGFSVKFFIYDNFKTDSNNGDYNYTSVDGNHDDITNLIRNKSEKSEIMFFSNNNDYEKIFEYNKLDLIYSDIFFDDRIIKLGLNQLSLKNFFVGYDGAINTIKSLINLCEMTFYKNYFKYFDN